MTSFYFCGEILDLERFERSYLSTEDIVAWDAWRCTENDGFRIYHSKKSIQRDT